MRTRVVLGAGWCCRLWCFVIRSRRRLTICGRSIRVFRGVRGLRRCIRRGICVGAGCHRFLCTSHGLCVLHVSLRVCRCCCHGRLLRCRAGRGFGTSPSFCPNSHVCLACRSFSLTGLSAYSAVSVGDWAMDRHALAIIKMGVGGIPPALAVGRQNPLGSKTRTAG